MAFHTLSYILLIWVGLEGGCEGAPRNQCLQCLSLGTVMGAAKAFEIGGACASVGQDVCVCLGLLWLLQAGTHGDLDEQIPACRPGILLGVDRQNIG